MTKPEFTKALSRNGLKDWPDLRGSQLGDLLGMSDRRVRQLAQNKLLPRTKDGLYPLRECIQAYIKYLKSNPSESADVKQLQYIKLKAETEERQAKAEAAQLDLDKARGELISRKDMIREWSSRCVEMRSALMSLPAELGFHFPDDDTRNKVEEVSDAYVRQTLETWSREGPYTPVETNALDG